jgi:disease resistance protein RPM1
LIFVEGNCGSRIITTTRNYEVAQETGEVYRLRPLSHDHSRKLFYTRIFGGEEKCPGVQSDEVSDKILKKCDGIPLAIITMASLLVGKPREVWPELYSDIGFGQHMDNTYVENTMRILSFSYYDLPSHLRTCLLYLSVYPEDHFIEKDPLIWKWIAEGFVYEKQGNGLFELVEQYFNDLINRSMIQVAEPPLSGEAGCRVHDMVLDLIRTLTHHENSVTLLNKNNAEVILSRNKQVRRLACQKYDLELITPQADRMDMPVVRSYIATACRINQRVPLLRFKLLRVLAIEDCIFTEGSHFEGLGDLLHLRYLSLRHTTNVFELPEEIGNLKLLQTFDVSGSWIRELPASIVRLTQLVCLNCGGIEMLPDGDWIGKLTSLEQLTVILGSVISGNDEYMFNVGRFVKELGSLRELGMLQVTFPFMDDSVQRYLVESLSSLDKIQRITLVPGFGYDADIATWETTGSMLPQHLSHLSLTGLVFPRLPPWVNPSRFHHLSSLEVGTESTDCGYHG